MSLPRVAAFSSFPGPRGWGLGLGERDEPAPCVRSTMPRSICFGPGRCCRSSRSSSNYDAWTPEGCRTRHRGARASQGKPQLASCAHARDSVAAGSESQSRRVCLARCARLSSDEVAVRRCQCSAECTRVPASWTRRSFVRAASGGLVLAMVVVCLSAQSYTSSWRT